MPILSPPFALPRPVDPRLTPEVVIRALAPLQYPERRRRIERVLRHRLLSVTVVLENLHDPHNGGAALRSCEALGLTHVHVVESCEQFQASHRVTKRAHKWLTVYRHPTVESCLELLQSWGFCCWAAVPPRPGFPPSERQVQADRPLALLFGNEHEGLSPAARRLCDATFNIPMYGFTESLNLSVSVAVATQQATARRRQHLGRPGDLPPAALQQLRAGYYALAERHAVPVVLRYLQGVG